MYYNFSFEDSLAESSLSLNNIYFKVYSITANEICRYLFYEKQLLFDFIISYYLLFYEHLAHKQYVSMTVLTVILTYKIYKKVLAQIMQIINICITPKLR